MVSEDTLNDLRKEANIGQRVGIDRPFYLEAVIDWLDGWEVEYVPRQLLPEDSDYDYVRAKNPPYIATVKVGDGYQEIELQWGESIDDGGEYDVVVIDAPFAPFIVFTAVMRKPELFLP